MTSPRWVRCYDNGGETADRYTVLFVGRRGGFGIGASEHPTHPQGVYQHFEWPEHENAPDVRPGAWSGPGIGRSCHLGKRIRFDEMPAKLRQLVATEYAKLWDLLPPAE